MKQLFLSLAWACASISTLFAQSQLSIHNFQDTLVATGVATHLSVSSVSLSSGTFGFQNGTDDGGTRIGNSASWPQVAFAPSGKYLQFSIEPLNGYALQLSELSFRFGRTAAGPQQITIAWSDDGFEDDTTYLLQNAAVTSTDANALNAFSITTNLPAATTNTITIRIWGHNASGSGNLRFNNFRLFGQLNAPTPTLSLNPTSLSGLVTDSSQASASGTVQISGAFLTGSGQLLLDARQTAFELARQGGSFADTLQFTHSSGSFATQSVEVRLKAGLANGTYNQQITFSGGGANAVQLAASGLVLTPPPPVQLSGAASLRIERDSLGFATTNELGRDSLSFKLYNDGSAVLTGRLRTFAMYGHRAFWTPDSVFTIAGGDSVSVKVYFEPRHNIFHRSLMWVEVRTGTGEQFIKLTGQGTYSRAYYNPTQNLVGASLLQALRTITGSPYTQLGYSTTNSARMRMFHQIDNWKVNGRAPNHPDLYVNDCVYTGRIITYNSALSTGTLDNAPYNFNTEHIWPQSYGASSEPMRSDLHHLTPVDRNTNSARGNKHLGWVPNPTLFYTGGSKASSTVFEPRDAAKGFTARALLYFAMRYGNLASTDLSLITAFENDLRAWVKLFPPDSVEFRRNNDIQAQQLNRNPFIDHPELLDRITNLGGTPGSPVQFELIRPDTLRAGALSLGQQRTYRVPLLNTGNQTIQLNQISLSGSGWQYQGPASLQLAPGEAVYLDIQLNFNQTGQPNAQLQLQTNLPGQATIHIPLQAQVDRSRWNGNGSWTDAQHWNNRFVPTATANPLIESGVAELADTLQLQGLEIAANASLRLMGGGGLKTTGNVVNHGLLVVEDGAAFLPAEQAILSGTGSYEVKRQGQSSNLRVNYFSSPVINADLLGTFSQANPADLWRFQHGAAGSAAWQQATGVMEAGRGYSVAGAGLVTFAGQVHHGDFIPVSTSTGPGFYLLGNPYPAPLSADAFLAFNGPNGIGSVGGALYFWSQQQNATGSNFASADYAVWAGGTGVAGSGSNAGSAVPTGQIGVAQGFFVTPGFFPFDVYLKADMRSSMQANQFFRSGGPIGRIWLNAIGQNAGFSQLAVVFRDDASPSRDAAYDANRWETGAPLVFSSLLHDTALAIQALPWPTQTAVLPLQVKLTEVQGVTFSIDSLQGLDSSVVLLLEDRQLQRFYPLRQQSPTISLAAGTYNQRFYLHVGQALQTQVEQLERPAPKVFVAHQQLHVQQAQPGDLLQLFNAAGQLLFETRLTESQAHFDLPMRGVILVQLQGKNHQLRKKLVAFP